MKSKRIHNEYILSPFFDDRIPEEDFVSFEDSLQKDIKDFDTDDIVVGYYDKSTNTVKIFDNFNDNKFTKEQFKEIIQNFAKDNARGSFVIFKDIELDTIEYFMSGLIYQDIYNIVNMESHVYKEFGKKLVLGYAYDLDID
jgi:hypothetical protein